MTLLTERWIPIRRRNGSCDWISPAQISEPEITGLNASRADFKGALAQFLIALLQTTTDVEREGDWTQLLEIPPSSAKLQGWFRPYESAFLLDGDGARFFQDFGLTAAEGTPCDISALLIESPGENSLKNNSDHFVKRNQVAGMCRACAATALLTLQLNAPAGGAGHRTGLRGGGPLTTLLIGDPQRGGDNGQSDRSLWRDLWLNVESPRYFLARPGDLNATEHLIFPWLAANSKSQAEGGFMAPAMVHPAAVFFAMPRRIRLDFENLRPGECDICHRQSTGLIQRYITKNYGLNYKGDWNHPMSPYYCLKEEWLPVHPQPGGIGYRHWLAWIGPTRPEGNVRRAACVDGFMTRRERRLKIPVRLWAFGYDMDNMKARCWYESTMPLYELPECPPEAQREIAGDVSLWIDAAYSAGASLRMAVKDAWFGGDAQGDLSSVDASFWAATQERFYADLKGLISSRAAASGPPSEELRRSWQLHLAWVALRLFDGEFVGSGRVEDQHPARISKAYRRLKRALYEGPVLKILGLPKKIWRLEPDEIEMPAT